MSTPPSLSTKTARPPMQATPAAADRGRTAAAVGEVGAAARCGRNIYGNRRGLGPAEREAMRVALESFVGGGAPARADHPLQRSHFALLRRKMTPIPSSA
jgi:hypothetical protein